MTADIDAQVLVSLTTLAAKNALTFFHTCLQDAFPEARVISMTELEQMRGATERIAMLIAPVKGMARVRVKVQEYAKECGGDTRNWPFAQLLGDLLRATVVCADMDAFAEAWQRVVATFDVRGDHGRLKNNLFTSAKRPPDLLVNVSVEPPGYLPVMGEVQIHLLEILQLKESGFHRMYEIGRAPDLAALLEEAKKESAPTHDPEPNVEAAAVLPADEGNFEMQDLHGSANRTTFDSVNPMREEGDSPSSTAPRVTTYTSKRPAPSAAPAPAATPWQQIRDPASGSLYYHNEATGESSWEPPPGFV